MRFKKCLLLFVALAGCLGFRIFVPQKASAISRVVPDFNTSVYLEVSRLSSTNALDAPNVYLKAYFNSSAGGTVYLWDPDHCADGPDSNTAAPTTFATYRTNADEDMIGFPLLPASTYVAQTGKSMAPTLFGVQCGFTSLALTGLTESTTHPGYYVGVVTALHTGTAGGVNAFRVSVTNADTTDALIGYYSDEGVTSRPGDPGKALSFFSLQDRLGSDSTFSDFTFEFAPECSWGSQTAWLKWRDADWGQGNQESSAAFAFEFKEYDRNTGAFIRDIAINPPRGGQDVYEERSFTATSDSYYVWKWKHVQKTNGVQIYMPFSSIEATLKCDSEPGRVKKGNLDGAVCVAEGLNIPGWAIDNKDVQKPLPVDFYFDGPNGAFPGQASVGGRLADRLGNDLTAVATGVPGADDNKNHRLSTTDARSDRPAVTIDRATLAALGLDVGVHSVYGYAHDLDDVSFKLNFSGSPSATFQCPKRRYDLKPTYAITPIGNSVSVKFDVRNDGDGASKPAGATGVKVNYYIKKNGVEVAGSNKTFNDQVIGAASNWPTQNETVSGTVLGDLICAYIKVEPAEGETDGTIGVASREKTETGNCVYVTGKPYVQTWRGDVMAGGQFGQFNSTSQRTEPVGANCAPLSGAGQAGGIQTHSRGPGGGSEVFGSLAQYGVFANGKVELTGASGLQNFFSGNRNLSSAMNAKTAGNGDAFTFANTTANKGNFGGQVCIHDYYGQFEQAGTTKPLTGLTDETVDLATLADGAYKYTGDLIVTNSAPSGWLQDKHITLAVKGSVRLKSDITFADPATGKLTNNAGSLESRLEDISFLLVAVQGNIHIDSSVIRADGIWSAQPEVGANYGTTGIFDDCVQVGGANDGKPFSSVGDGAYYTQCNNAAINPAESGPGRGRLQINGSVLARRLRLLRLSGDIYYTNSGSSDSPRSSHAAEHFLPSSELQFSAPATNPTLNSGKYDAIENLAPVL